ncbi:MAG: thioredoxin domain-containing protein [Verrucomicrobiota bacterium]
MRRSLPFVLIILVLLLAVAGGYFLLHFQASSLPISAKPAPGNTTAGFTPDQVVAEPNSVSPILAPGAAGAEPTHVRGVATSPLTLEEFGDFQCSQCADLSTILKKIEEDYGSSLRVIFREYPLRKHERAYDAACAAEAAGLQGRFWEMHDLLYQNRSEWNPAEDSHSSLFGSKPYHSTTFAAREKFEIYAQKLGLDVERFQRDIDGEEVRTRIATDRARAASLNIDRTPTVYLNGQHVAPVANMAEGLRSVIDAELAAKKK